jgi:hypothetical protein
MDVCGAFILCLSSPTHSGLATGCSPAQESCQLPGRVMISELILKGNRLETIRQSKEEETSMLEHNIINRK